MIIDKNIKILIAEDEYIVSEDIIRGLKALGYSNFIEASNGVEALEMTCSQKPDVVLMDIMMPKLNGIESAKKIQEECPTPIIIITAYESTESLKNAAEAGASAYLTKPPQQEELERAIIIALARHTDLMHIRRLNKDLEKSMAEVKQLQGFIPICASCKNIRDDKGYWQEIERYITDHSEARFSHSICPDCAKKLYPDFIVE